MDNLSHMIGPLWEEFKYMNFASEVIETHEELQKEVLALYEVCKEHFTVHFTLSKTE
jgi:hypothetical protein